MNPAERVVIDTEHDGVWHSQEITGDDEMLLHGEVIPADGLFVAVSADTTDEGASIVSLEYTDPWDTLALFDFVLQPPSETLALFDFVLQPPESVATRRFVVLDPFTPTRL
jgi:hypothetical protein